MKKVKWVLAIALCVLVAWGVYTVVTVKNMKTIELREYPADYSEGISDDGEYYLLAEAESEEEAREIADLYGITFEKYQNGLGRYSTSKNPEELFQLGVENGYPELELNQKVFKDDKEGEGL